MSPCTRDNSCVNDNENDNENCVIALCYDRQTSCSAQCTANSEGRLTASVITVSLSVRLYLVGKQISKKRFRINENKHNNVKTQRT